MLESSNLHSKEGSNQDNERWDEDDHAYVSPVQLWIDEAYKSDDFSWYHLMIVDQTCIYEDGHLEVCMMLQLHEEHLPLVSKILAWIHWHYDIT